MWTRLLVAKGYFHKEKKEILFFLLVDNE